MATVLIVDDEFGIAQLLEDVLEDEGYNVFLATNGRRALDKIAQALPDLVITDFMMPVMDGAALIKALAAQTQTRAIPVIMMSSLPEEAVAERCSGYTLFLRKPFKIFDLTNMVTKLLAEAGPG